MKKRTLLLGWVILLSLIGALLYGLIRGLDENPALVFSVIAAGLTVGGSIYAVGYEARIQRRDEAARIHREKITDYYEELIRFIGRIAERADEDLKDEDVNFMQELSQKMTLWSVPGLIRTWAGWFRVLESNPVGADTLIAYGRNLKAIRAEMGHDDSELDIRDLLRLFVNDVDEHIPAGLK